MCDIGKKGAPASWSRVKVKSRRALQNENGGGCPEEKGDGFICLVTEKTYLMTCEQCGGELASFRQGSAQGVKCTRCGWSVVTTNIQGVKVDETKYEVRCRGDYQDKAHIRAVSEVTGSNFLTSRNMLQKGLVLVFVGQAEEVLRVRTILVSAGVVCEITPDFNWV